MGELHFRTFTSIIDTPPTVLTFQVYHITLLLRNKGLFGCVCKIYFLFLKIKNTKNLFEEENFVFSMFSKIIFFIIIKMCFYYFFHYSNNRLFFMFYFSSFCVFLTVFYVSTNVNSIQLPHPYP